MELSQLGKAAYYYAKFYNWSVFPLIPKMKIPFKNTNGLTDATANLNQIYKWWINESEANIALATGKISGVFILDIDGENGESSLDYLIKKYGELPHTVEAISGKGRHLYFKYPTTIDGTIKSCSNAFKEEFVSEEQTEIKTNLDIRGDGGYIVLPPSVHPNGHLYEWELSSRPNENEIAEAPEWLIELVTATPQEEGQARPTNYWSTIMQGVSKGGRNNAATELAGKLLYHYVPIELVTEIIELWNSERNKPSLKDKELEIILGSVYKKELQSREKKRGGFKNGY